MIGTTWHQGCPIPLADLRYVTINYWGTDQQSHHGALVVHQKIASDVQRIFNQLERAHFPLQSVTPMHAFNGDDDASMRANNTSAFNCRAVTGKPGVFSQHSYGAAIDINPLQNPYVKGDTVLPHAGSAFLSRDALQPGMLEPVVSQFTAAGFTWGGNWHSLKDYQHVEKRP